MLVTLLQFVEIDTFHRDLLRDNPDGQQTAACLVDVIALFEGEASGVLEFDGANL